MSPFYLKARCYSKVVCFCARLFLRTCLSHASMQRRQEILLKSHRYPPLLAVLFFVTFSRDKMTRYTKMRKKTHVKADDAMVVNPLKPKGKQSTDTGGSDDPIGTLSKDLVESTKPCMLIFWAIGNGARSRKMQGKGNKRDKRRKLPYPDADRKKRKMVSPFVPWIYASQQWINY